MLGLSRGMLVPVMAVVVFQLSACAERGDSPDTGLQDGYLDSLAHLNFEAIVPLSSAGVLLVQDGVPHDALTSLSVLVLSDIRLYRVKVYTRHRAGEVFNSGVEVMLSRNEFEDLIRGIEVSPEYDSYLRYYADSVVVNRRVERMQFARREDTSFTIAIELGAPFCPEASSSCSSLLHRGDAVYLGLVGASCQIVSTGNVVSDLQFDDSRCRDAVEPALLDVFYDTETRSMRDASPGVLHE